MTILIHSTYELRRHAMSLVNSTVHDAFPASLSADVDRHLTLLTPPEPYRLHEPFPVSCGGETLLIPSRIYFAVPSIETFRCLGATEQNIVACWFTRHHDGHVRERFLRALPALDRLWTIPYVVALCGEYVVELLCYIWERRELFDRRLLGQWLRENETFYALTHSRIISYWDCYHRPFNPQFADYVGSHLLAFFKDCIVNSESPTSV